MQPVCITLHNCNIIEHIQKLEYGYKDESIQIGSIFYMDDGIIFCENNENMSRLVITLGRICLKYGIKFSKSKCKIMMINDKESVDKIEEIDVSQNIKYLSVIIDSKNKCFNSQKNKTLHNGLKLSNQIYSVLGNCCNRMLVGKTYWKVLALP